MMDIEVLKKYGIIGTTISVRKCDYTQLFDDNSWEIPKQCKEVKKFYKHYDKFKKRRK